MRITRLLRDLLGLKSTRVRDVSFDDEGLVVDVAPSWRRPRCSACGRKCRGYDKDPERRWRHLDMAGMQVHLRYDIRRVECRRCGRFEIESEVLDLFRSAYEAGEERILKALPRLSDAIRGASSPPSLGVDTWQGLAGD